MTIPTSIVQLSEGIKDLLQFEDGSGVTTNPKIYTELAPETIKVGGKELPLSADIIAAAAHWQDTFVNASLYAAGQFSIAQFVADPNLNEFKTVMPLYGDDTITFSHTREKPISTALTGGEARSNFGVTRFAIDHYNQSGSRLPLKAILHELKVLGAEALAGG